MAKNYPIPWIATYLLFGLLLIGLSFYAVFYVNRWGSDYERDDPDFDFLERIARSDMPREGDFEGLNGGDWRVLCLVGAKGDVVKGLRAAAIPEPAATAIAQAFADKPSELHESEFTLAYVPKDGAVKLLRHPHGFAFARAGQSVCTAREKPLLALPAGAGT